MPDTATDDDRPSRQRTGRGEPGRRAGQHDYLVRPDDLCDGVAIEFDSNIDIGTVNVFWRGGVYKLVAVDNNTGRWDRLDNDAIWLSHNADEHRDHFIPHPYDERLWYDPVHHFIAWRRDDD